MSPGHSNEPRTKEIIKAHYYREQEIAQAKEEVRFLKSQFGKPDKDFAYLAVGGPPQMVIDLLKEKEIILTNKFGYFSNRTPATKPSNCEALAAATAVNTQGYAIFVFQKDHVQKGEKTVLRPFPKTSPYEYLHPGQIHAIITPTPSLTAIKTALLKLNTEAPQFAVSMLGWKEYLEPNLTIEIP